MQIQRLKHALYIIFILKSMKQKMYSLDINLYVQQRSLSHEKKFTLK